MKDKKLQLAIPGTTKQELGLSASTITLKVQPEPLEQAEKRRESLFGEMVERATWLSVLLQVGIAYDHARREWLAGKCEKNQVMEVTEKLLEAWDAARRRRLQ